MPFAALGGSVSHVGPHLRHPVFQCQRQTAASACRLSLITLPLKLLFRRYPTVT